MIISVSELARLIDVESYTEDKLLMILDGLEKMIRNKTNNHFHVKTIRFDLEVVNGQLVGSFHHLSVGDTVEVSESQYNQNYLSDITAISDGVITMRKPLQDEDSPITITKVVYPSDIVQGVVNLIDWEIHNRDKVGIKSESLSRHSVTYYDNGDGQMYGYPKSMMDFIRPYCKARF